MEYFFRWVTPDVADAGCWLWASPVWPAAVSWEFLSCLGHYASLLLPFVLDLPSPEVGPVMPLLLWVCLESAS